MKAQQNKSPDFYSRFQQIAKSWKDVKKFNSHM
jgi:hypothetical protein